VSWIATPPGRSTTSFGTDPPARIVIDISLVDEVSGALIGALLRASRRLAWRKRRLTIARPQADLRSRLEIAGLDELADVIASLDPA
jgi:anti-anti-sigma regulatory factor